jgi:superoxide dismutase, Cu-Zn family
MKTNGIMSMACVMGSALLAGACEMPLEPGEEGNIETVVQAEVGVGGKFIIFDPNLGKAGGVVGQLQSSAFGGVTTSDLFLSKAPPNKNWGAIAHVDGCNVNQGGARYRNDPQGGSNAANEIWLDVKTNNKGQGSSRSVVKFVVRTDGAKSLVLYQNPAASGNVGARIACLDFPWDHAE